jgi:hypothetical protein
MEMTAGSMTLNLENGFARKMKHFLLETGLASLR